VNAQIWIVDFGSQYTQLIARIYRELGFKSEILTIEQSFELLKSSEPGLLILSGGPQSVFEDSTDYSAYFSNKFPVLGICYGMQLMAQFFGGKVHKGIIGEYGKSYIHDLENTFNLGEKFITWMSHSDHVSECPKGFNIFLKSENDLIAGIKHCSQNYWGLQFHPEVIHTVKGKEILLHFVDEIGLKSNWDNKEILQNCLDEVSGIGDEYVLCAFSGGVDSLVAASIAHKELCDKLYCFFVDNGLLRPQDYKHIEVLKKQSHLNIETIDAKEIFLNKLNSISEPEEKRKIIGATFIEVFDQKVKEFERDRGIKFTYLLQGTLYPDIIESHSPHLKGGKSVTIKSHHNVGGLPEKMNLKLLEPLKSLFKDEVRKIGTFLGLDHSWLYRHPFPGPGLGIRILGAINAAKIEQVQKSDQILLEELLESGYYNKCWQSLTVHIPQKTVGVKGDARAYEEVICVRIVGSRDGMTATWSHVPYDVLDRISSRITNEVSGITRVVYDITSKPPGTIEWE